MVYTPLLHLSPTITYFSSSEEVEEEEAGIEDSGTASVLSLGKSQELEDEEDDGGEFVVEGEEEKDDEETIAEEEKLQAGDGYESELEDLQKEGIYYTSLFLLKSLWICVGAGEHYLSVIFYGLLSQYFVFKI